MTDKERILMSVIRSLGFTNTLCGDRWNPATFTNPDGYVRPHMASYIHENDFKPGMLVVCRSSPLGDWSVAWLVEPLGYSDWLLREIGTERTCRMMNEMFTPIVGMRQEDLLEGAAYTFLVKVKKAMAWLYKDSYNHGSDGWEMRDHRCRNARKDGDSLVITIGCKWNGVDWFGEPGAKEYEIALPIKKSVTIKGIVAALLAAGYGAHEWEPIDPVAASAYKEEQLIRKARIEAEREAKRVDTK